MCIRDSGDAGLTAGNPLIWFGNGNYAAARTVNSMEILIFFDSRTAVRNSFEVVGFSRRDMKTLGAVKTVGGTKRAQAYNWLAAK